MAQPARLAERLEGVAQHVQIGVDLVLVAPAAHQIRLLVQRGVDDMRHAGELGRMPAAGRRVLQVEADEPRRRLEIRRAAGDADHPPAARGEPLDRGPPEQAEGPENEDRPAFLGHQPPPAFTGGEGAVWPETRQRLDIPRSA